MLTVDTDINSVRVWTALGLNTLGNSAGAMPFLNSTQSNIPPVYSIVSFLNAAYWPYEPMVFEDTIGVNRQFGYSRDKLTFATLDMGYDGNRDHRRYGGILGQLNQAYTLLFKGNFAFSSDGEHETYHPSYSGSVVPKGDWALPALSDAFSTVVPIIGGSLSVPGAIAGPAATYFCNNMVVSDGYPGKTVVPIWQNLYWKGYKTDVATRLNWLANNPALLTRSWTAYKSLYTVNYSGVSWKSEGNSITVDFNCFWSILSGTKLYYWNYACTLRLVRRVVFPQPAGSIANGNTAALFTTMSFSLDASVEWTCTGRHFLDPIGFGSPAVGQKGLLTWKPLADPIYLGNPFRPLAVTPPSVSEIRDTRIRDAFCPLVLERINDIRVAAYYSTADAFQGVQLGIDTNLVEAFAEIDEIVTLLPSIKTAMKEIMKIRSSPLFESHYARVWIREKHRTRVYDVKWERWNPLAPLNTISQVIDWVTGMQLFFSFAFSPSVKLLVDVLPAMLDILQRIPTSRQPVVSRYGNITYPFPDWEFGREKAELVCRTKLSIRTSWGDVLDSAIGIRSLGILPSPGFVWDALPFSFVLDWFTRIGDRVRTLELAGMLIPVAIQSIVHSYTVTSAFTPLELEQLRIQGRPGTKTPGVKFYKREVSCYIPTPRRGRYDFLAAQFLPDLGIAGSLLWQILRG